MAFKMCLLNKDVVEKLIIEPYDEQTENASMVMVLKRFGEDFGISQKFIYSKTTMNKTDNNYSFNTVQITNKPNMELSKKLYPVKYTDARLLLSFKTPHFVEVSYNFSLEIDEDMPKSMENLPGLLMKKLFIRAHKLKL